MKARIRATADGTATGVFFCTEKQFAWLQEVVNCIGKETDESYSPSVSIEKVFEGKDKDGNT